jgi:putative hemolysin
MTGACSPPAVMEGKNKMSKFVFVVLILAVLTLVACGNGPTPTPEIFESIPAEPPSDAGTFDSPLNMANPASVFCEEQGYSLEMREEAGGTAGYCTFPDGTECEEWAFFREECGPGTPQP